MINENNNFDNRIKLINKKFEDLVNLVEKKPNFYNNIFFEVNSKKVLNLINTNYINVTNKTEKISINKNNIIDENDSSNSNYLLNEPLYKFDLPDSDDSDNEENIEKRESSFKSICDQVIDTEVLEIIDINTYDKADEETIPKNIFPILMFKSIPELSSINDILKIFSNYICIKPYEIKRLYVPSLNNYIFLVKLHSLDEANKSRAILSKKFKNNFHISYDKRELKDSKWFCVIFRRECNKDKNNYKFKDIIEEIFEKINSKEKKIISNNEDGNIFGKCGKAFYSAIKVGKLNEALNLCLKYNNYNNLKVNLHYLTYQNSKKVFPKALTQKNYSKKIKKSIDEDTQIYNKLFGDLKKKKKYKNDY